MLFQTTLTGSVPSTFFFCKNTGKDKKVDATAVFFDAYMEICNADLGSQCGIKKGSIQIAAVFYISGNQFLLK